MAVSTLSGMGEYEDRELRSLEERLAKAEAQLQQLAAQKRARRKKARRQPTPQELWSEKHGRLYHR
jgi:50S ribosomal subunit-associated GTPase HflX